MFCCSADQTHSSPKNTIKFYSAWFCPYAQRVWFTLEHHNIPYEIIPSLDMINGKVEKNPRLLELNPKGQVPTLEFSPEKIEGKVGVKKDKLQFVGDSIVVTESWDTMEFLNSIVEKREDEGGTRDLFPDATLLSDAKQFDQRICSFFYIVLTGSTRKVQKEAFNLFANAISDFMAEVEDDGFYKSTNYGLVDFAIVPHLLRIPILKHHRPMFQFEDVLDEECIAKFESYLQRMKGLECVKKTLWKDEQPMIDMYKLYAGE
jgi:glutathione S-transferase